MILKSFLNLVYKHVTEITGSMLGLGSGVYGMAKGMLVVSDDIHAIVLAFFTGAAGGLGALLIKVIWNGFTKRKKASVSPEREPGSPRAKHE